MKTHIENYMHPSLKKLLNEIQDNMDREIQIDCYHELMYSTSDLVEATKYLDIAMKLCEDRPIYMIEVMEEAKIDRILNS